MSKDNLGKDQIRQLLITIVLLACGFVFACFFLPKIKIWSIPRTYNEEVSHKASLSEEVVYEESFEMPFKRICFLGMELDPMESDRVVKLDATLELCDSNGNVVVSKEVTSVFDTNYSFGYIDVDKGSQYTVRFVFRGSEAEDYMIPPAIALTDQGGFMFNINGLSGSSDDIFVFSIMYLLLSTMTLLFVLNLNKNKLGDAKFADWLIVGVIYLLAIFVVSQQYDLFTIGKTAFRMVESFGKGHFFDYIEESFLAELSHQSFRSLFTYNYKFLIILAVAVFLIPLYPFFDGDMVSEFDSRFISLYLTLVVAVLIFVAAWLFKYITKECGMDNRYLKNARMLFLTSSFLLFCALAFGSIDIFYVIVVLIALPFYYRKKYVVFSLIMSVAIAMKLLPLMIYIPLILLVNKKIRDLIINFAVAMSFTLLTKVLFENNSYYLSSTNEPFVERLASINVGDLISVFVVLFVLICIIAYFYKPDVDNKKEMLFYSMLLIFTVYGSFAVFVDWHTQWLVPLALSASFLIPFFKENRILMILDLVLEGLLILYANTKGASTYLINYGIFPRITGQIYSGTSMKIILNTISPITLNLIVSSMCAVVVYMVWYMYKNHRKIQDDDVTTYECSRPWVIGRTGLLYGFILFYCWCFSFIG